MKKFLKRFLIFLLILAGLLWLYANSLVGVEKQAKDYYAELKAELEAEGYKARMYVISGRRYQPDNWLLNRFGGAAKGSKHLDGQAIDVVVLDVNEDGKADAEDVDIVYELLDKKIIRDKGGIGTYYKNSKDFFSRQMVHFDCRGRRARWRR
ncbi:MAG: hypothetical protein R3B47_04950 [Bacteroidia bacterium]